MWSRCLLAVLCSACVWSTVTRAQVLDSPRPQPLQLTAPLTSQCCGLRGQLLFQCLTNATTGEDAARAREDAEVSLFTYLTPNILSYAALTSAVNAIYAEANGYRFDIILQDENNSYEPRDPRWNKVKILIDAMNNSDYSNSQYFVWIDADMTVLDMGVKMEGIGLQFPDADIIMSSDAIADSPDSNVHDIPPGQVNSGLIFVRNTPLARHILLQWWSGYERSRMSDQSAFILLFNEMPKHERDKLAILRPDALNTLFPAWLNQQSSNQFLHLAGESDIYREEVFGLALQTICDVVSSFDTSVSGELESERSFTILPPQLGLSRERLFREWSILDSHRIARLISLRDDFIALREEFNQRSKKKKVRVINEYEEFVDSSCSGIHNILKNSANEKNEKKHRNERNAELDEVTIEIKRLCFSSQTDIADTHEIIHEAREVSSDGKSKITENVDKDIVIAEKFRSAMSSGYDLINFASEVNMYSPVDFKNRFFSEKDIFDLLDKVGKELLPRLKKHLPSSLTHRGLYYEFKYYEFLSIALTEYERGDAIMDAMANAISVWKVLHNKHKYYGSDYYSVDRLREGWTITSKYGLMACSEASGVLTQLGVDVLKDSIKLLETTFSELGTNALATPQLQSSVALDLSITHANCGLCNHQLNMKLSPESDSSEMIANLKKSRNHLEKSLHYLQHIDGHQSSAQHGEYVSARISDMTKEIIALQGTKQSVGSTLSDSGTSIRSTERREDGLKVGDKETKNTQPKVIKKMMKKRKKM